VRLMFMLDFNPKNYDETHLQITKAARDLIDKDGGNAMLLEKTTHVKEGGEDSLLH
jgi:hypothetical protein